MGWSIHVWREREEVSRVGGELGGVAGWGGKCRQGLWGGVDWVRKILEPKNTRTHELNEAGGYWRVGGEESGVGWGWVGAAC